MQENLHKEKNHEIPLEIISQKNSKEEMDKNVEIYYQRKKKTLFQMIKHKMMKKRFFGF